MPDARSYLDLITGTGAAPAPAPGPMEAVPGRTRMESGGNAPDRKLLLDKLREEVAYVEGLTGVAVDEELVRDALAQAGYGLERLFSDGDRAVLDERAVFGLEAVVRADGSRPVLFVQDDFVDVMAPSAGRYSSALSAKQHAVRRACRAVGRVDDPSEGGRPLGYHGTAWMVGEGLVATNYHVLQAIAPGCTRDGGVFRGSVKAGVTVDFGWEAGPHRRTLAFPVKRVHRVGPSGKREHDNPVVDGETLHGVNFDGVDLAILELETVPGQAMPQPLDMARGDDPRTHGSLASTGRGIFLVGYPGNEQGATPDLFSKIFGGVKSYKRLAPGAIMSGLGQVPGDARGWLLTHDCSTLGGNSGSALCDLDAPEGKALGLHFAGLHLQRNWAHALERITDQFDGLAGRKG